MQQHLYIKLTKMVNQYDFVSNTPASLAPEPLASRVNNRNPLTNNPHEKRGNDYHQKQSPDLSTMRSPLLYSRALTQPSCESAVAAAVEGPVIRATITANPKKHASKTLKEMQQFLQDTADFSRRARDRRKFTHKCTANLLTMTNGLSFLAEEESAYIVQKCVQISKQHSICTFYKDDKPIRISNPDEDTEDEDEDDYQEGCASRSFLEKYPDAESEDEDMDEVTCESGDEDARVDKNEIYDRDEDCDEILPVISSIVNIVTGPWKIVKSTALAVSNILGWAKLCKTAEESSADGTADHRPSLLLPTYIKERSQKTKMTINISDSMKEDNYFLQSINSVLNNLDKISEDHEEKEEAIFAKEMEEDDILECAIDDSHCIDSMTQHSSIADTKSDPPTTVLRSTLYAARNSFINLTTKATTEVLSHQTILGYSTSIASLVVPQSIRSKIPDCLKRAVNHGLKVRGEDKMYPDYEKVARETFKGVMGLSLIESGFDKLLMENVDERRLEGDNALPTLSFSFASGVGVRDALYMIEVAEELRSRVESDVLKKARFLGAGFGAIIAAAMALGVDLSSIRSLFKLIEKKCNERCVAGIICPTKMLQLILTIWCRLFGGAWQMSAILRDGLEQHFPQELSLGDNLVISMTKFRTMENLLADTFANRTELLDALLASCCLPVRELFQHFS
jgi:hypothetical protein